MSQKTARPRQVASCKWEWEGCLSWPELQVGVRFHMELGELGSCSITLHAVTSDPICQPEPHDEDVRRPSQLILSHIRVFALPGSAHDLCGRAMWCKWLMMVSLKLLCDTGFLTSRMEPQPTLTRTWSNAKMVGPKWAPVGAALAASRHRLCGCRKSGNGICL